MNRGARLKAQLVGAVLDAPRFTLAVRAPRLARRLGLPWETLHNRGERISKDVGQRGVRCHWRWTSSLRYCELRPAMALQLARRAFTEWPLALADAPARQGQPRVSFIIGHRGTERLPLLLATIASIAGQESVSVECVVVEQDSESRLTGILPSWVRHVHTVPPVPAMPYSRSWAFNIGASVAAGEVIVLHDNDILAPKAYAAEVMRLLTSGFDAARLQRFVFYLGPDDTHRITSDRSTVLTHPPMQVVQNCEGHTLAVRQDAYRSIGGHDEAFQGWGGEDNEIFDRLRTCRLHDHAYLPFLHLHHAPQAGKGARHANSTYFDDRMGISPTVRIEELRKRPCGQMSGPIQAAIAAPQ